MSALVQHTGISAVTLADAGTSRSTSSISWTVVAPSWEGHPQIPEAPATGVLAETIMSVGVRSRSRGGAAQIRLGFRAYRDRLVTVTFERPLAKAADGRFRPAGPWTHTSRIHNASVPIRTSGSVPAGRLDAGVTTAGGSQAANPVAGFREAAEAESYLPPVVRASLRAAVAAPELHIATFLLHDAGMAQQCVTGLRLDGAAAVAVSAVRADRADAPWTVTQWVYRLIENRRAIGR